MAEFQFTELFGDARLEELKLLSWADSQGGLSFPSVPTGPWQDLLLALVSDEILTTFSIESAKKMWARPDGPNPDLVNSPGLPGETMLERATHNAKLRAVYDLLESRPPAGLRLTHRGRVRLAEMKQALRSGREREPFGILWDVRHWQHDAQIAILEATDNSPLSVVYLDMNGLKALNDSCGHDTGDQALKTYFQAIATILADRGHAYRLGGDEVLVLLPNCRQGDAQTLVTAICKMLMAEWRDNAAEVPLLSIAAGIVACKDATSSTKTLRAAAVEVQYRAKERSKESTPRPSVIAIAGQDQLIVLEHDAFART